MRNKNIIPLIALTMLLVGCTTLYTGVVTITKVVDTAMKAWADLSVKGHTSAAIDAKVIQAHNQYRAACGVAQTALVAYKVSGDPAQYQKAVDMAKQAANELLDIIVPLLVPEKATALKSQLEKARVL